MPATDSSADTIGMVDLCGPRIYEIVETEPQNFMTITAPADGLDYLSPWSLDALSNDLIDVGVWVVTLRATLQNYPLITTEVVIDPATVLHPCSSAVIET